MSVSTDGQDLERKVVIEFAGRRLKSNRREINTYFDVYSGSISNERVDVQFRTF